MATTPKPLGRKEIYLDYLANGGNIELLPKPIGRIEQYLYYLCKNGFAGGGGTGEGGTTNYNALQNRPKINGVTLQGDLNTNGIGITIPEALPTPNPITFGGMLLNQTYNGSESVNVVFPDVEVLNETAGTPVGEIISYMGATAPPNYLICDGDIKQIADYPYLAQHFVDNFGKANYFGGDGVTTFAVPDLRGEFLRGTGTAARNTGSGSGVGVHQNATEIQNVFADNGNRNLYVFRSSNGGASVVNQDKVIGTRNGQSSFNASAQNNNASSQISIYTPRPTNTSVLYCIKYKPTYFARIEAESET